MSKELYFTDGNNEVKYLDTTASFNLAITQDGSAFDLTNATAIDVKVANDTGYVFDKSIDMATIKQPLAGLITMPVDAEVMNALVPDDYTIEVWVTLSSLITPGSQEGLTDGSTTSTTTSSTGTTTYNAIFPSDDPQGFTITENVMSDSGDVIPVMSLDEFQQEFDQLKTDLTNKVATLQGPQGLKGDPGEGLDIKGQVNSVSALPTTANEGTGYLVNEELYVWTNGAWKDCGSIQGPQGIPGKTGTGISSTTIQYQISNSATTMPTGAWYTNIQSTTTANPYLWMRAILSYDDGTSKPFYLVSSKGDKGDKGDTGATGPVGPQGPVGAGLVVKGTVSNASQLPTDGNQEGYCYFVGTDLYVWVNGAWKNCGNVSPDLKNYVTVTDLNNGLSTKVNVTDMRKPASDVAGIEEVNVKADDSKVAHLSGANNFDTIPTVNNNPLLLASSLPSDLARTGADNKFTGANSFDQDPVDKDGIAYRSGGPNLAPGTSDDWQKFSGEGWVNTFASGKITGLESGNTYTVTAEYRNNTVPIKIELYRYDKNNAQIIKDYVQSAIVTANSSGKLTLTFTNTFSDSAYIMLGIAASTTQTTTQSYEYRRVKLEKGSTSTPWEPSNYDVLNRVIDNGDGSIAVNGNSYTPANDSKVVHSTDMRKPASDVAGIEEVNAKQDKLTIAPADDAKVVHNTGAEEVSGQKTFDTAPIDKATGNPYITKDGVPAVPSTLADTTKLSNFTAGLQKGGADVATQTDVTTAISTATANMVDSTKATNFTAGLQSGGVDVATAADLKSVEASAWRVLDQSNAPSFVSFRGQVLYKIDDTNKTIYFVTNGTINNFGSNLILINFKGIVNNLLSSHGRWASISNKTNINDSDITVSSTYVKNANPINSGQDSSCNLTSYGDPGKNYAYVIYDSLVNN